MTVAYLNRLAPDAVLNAVDCRTPEPAMPIETACPLCSGRLVIYYDAILHVPWHYCHGCQSAGDLVDLAAAAWGMMPAEAARKLAGLGVIDDTDIETKLAAYAAGPVARRTRMNALWEKSRYRILDARPVTIRKLMAAHRLDSPLAGDGWKNGPGLAVGCCHVKDVYAAFQPSYARKRAAAELAAARSAGVVKPGRKLDPDGQRCASGKIVFTGGGWDDVLVFPYHTLPGRLSGFLFVGRAGAVADQVFRPAPISSEGGRYSSIAGVTTAEAGLHGLPWVAASGLPYGREVIALSDPAWAARLQVRHAAVSRRPLPIVSWYERGTTMTTEAAWAALEGKVPVFWETKWTPALLYQAVVSNGRVAVMEPYAGSTWKHAQVHALVKQVLGKAKPWHTALEEWAATATYAEVENLIMATCRYGIADKLPLAGEIIASAVPGGMTRVAMYRDVRVVERDGSWWIGASPDRQRQLSNTIIRIDRLGGKDGKLNGTGRAINGGKEYPFEFETGDGNKAATVAMAAIRRVLLRHGVAFCYNSTCWRSEMIEIALLFHRPQID